MVLITIIVTGAYKPTYNWGASHCTDRDLKRQCPSPCWAGAEKLMFQSVPIHRLKIQHMKEKDPTDHFVFTGQFIVSYHTTIKILSNIIPYRHA